MVQLGKKYGDKITKFVGVATGRCIYLSGCNQILLTPTIDKDGKIKDAHWFDEQRLEQIGDEEIVLDNGDTPGFDQPAPKY